MVKKLQVQGQAGSQKAVGDLFHTSINHASLDATSGHLLLPIPLFPSLARNSTQGSIIYKLLFSSP